MQVAALLSDLTSLQICDPKAALALVRARPSGNSTAEAETMALHEDHDTDLKRAKDLVELHASVKVAHENGTDKGLDDARSAVEKVLREL
ncbi:hypothetical protein EJ03DRAFT_214211 [Teratosphaeria nubilosa]|uniref:Uncharacterized protein n=1 Tax=Teratosphaeria nubilosa TaxID=161662 RepID=A0A6G1LGY8_9PEZI|nr:hypothetical protein EJ03DRAFT_214211 [Teratosphaeria nubilosa]